MTDKHNPIESTLPEGIRARMLNNGNGLDVHVLEAGFETPDRPCVLLLHGFPELAYSWRKVMMPLARAGFHVIAPDQRGYGRTTGWDADYDGDLNAFSIFNLVRDALGLLAAFDYQSVHAVIGHDFGSPVAACCALIRPDVFRSVVLMSAPFAGPPAFKPTKKSSVSTIDHAALAALETPRKHYQWYYSTREANADMLHCEQGLHDFFRAYYHHKSADWLQNRPYPLASWAAEELAKMPTYYIMEQNQTMAETVAPEMPSAEAVASCQWLPENELRVYSSEYARTGFQGGLQWYRCATGGHFSKDLKTFAGRCIDVPSMFIAGKSDWGTYQKPGEFEAMQDQVCTQMRGCHLLDGAGHWVQQEQPQQVSELLINFLQQAAHS